MSDTQAAKIAALVHRMRAFDAEYAAIVVLQHATPEVRPSVVAAMVEYDQRMSVFEADLAALSRPEFDALTQAIGF